VCGIDSRKHHRADLASAPPQEWRCGTGAPDHDPATKTRPITNTPATTMTTAAMATYAYDQIDQARTELEHPS
jgi:hypothetical protein